MPYVREHIASALALCIFSVPLASPTNAESLRCDTPGVAQFVIADMFANNPSAQKLGLEVESVTLLRVDDSGAEVACFVSVLTNHGYEMHYRFVFAADGKASLDLVP
jgi:hypothetical protein